MCIFNENINDRSMTQDAHLNRKQLLIVIHVYIDFVSNQCKKTGINRIWNWVGLTNLATGSEYLVRATNH